MSERSLSQVPTHSIDVFSFNPTIVSFPETDHPVLSCHCRDTTLNQVEVTVESSNYDENDERDDGGLRFLDESGISSEGEGGGVDREEVILKIEDV